MWWGRWRRPRVGFWAVPFAMGCAWVELRGGMRVLLGAVAGAAEACFKDTASLKMKCEIGTDQEWKTWACLFAL